MIRQGLGIESNDYQDLGRSDRKVFGGPSHYLKPPFERVAVLDENSYNMMVDPSFISNPKNFQVMVDSRDGDWQGDLGRQSDGAERTEKNVPSDGGCKPILLPDTNEAGWPAMVKAMENSHRKATGDSQPPVSSRLGKPFSSPQSGASSPEEPGFQEKGSHQNKWDEFPGLKMLHNQGGVVVLTPLHLIAAPFRQGKFADPRRLKRLVTSINKRASKIKEKDEEEEEEEEVEEEEEGADDNGVSHLSTLQLSKKPEKYHQELASQPVHQLEAAPEEMTSAEAQLTKTFEHSYLTVRTQRPAGEEPREPDADLPDSSRTQPRLSADFRELELADSEAAKDSFADPNELQSSLKETGKLMLESFGGVTFINKFALVNTLGKGSFGTVKLALNTEDMKLYALKLLPRSRRNTGITDPDVWKEINVMKKLNHPNLTSLHEVIDDPLNSKVLMVLEYSEGGALMSGDRMTPKRRLNESHCRHYFRDVLQGLDYLHANKIAHGDLKVANLLLSSTGRIKIADFGSSQLMRRGEVVRRTSGTPAFMAPELCSGAPYHARLADVWSLGVCLYMFICGDLPFKADTIFQLYEVIQNMPLQFPEDVFLSDSLKHLIGQLLTKDPSSRISLAEVMSHSWVTHNGAHPLTILQEPEDKDASEPSALLMESWPDPIILNLGSMLHFIAPLFEVRAYADGAYLAQRGEVQKGVFYVDEGEVEIHHTSEALEEDSTTSSDEEDDKADIEAERLRQNPTMLKIMYEAAGKANKASASKYTVGGVTHMTAIRGRGTYLGETSQDKGRTQILWKTDVQARGPVKALVVSYAALRRMLDNRTEVEADVRAITAQRHAEMNCLQIQEKLVCLYEDLKELL